MLIFRSASSTRAPSAPATISRPFFQVSRLQVFTFPIAQHPHTAPPHRNIPQDQNEATAPTPKPLQRLPNADFLLPRPHFFDETNPNFLPNCESQIANRKFPLPTAQHPRNFWSPPPTSILSTVRKLTKGLSMSRSPQPPSPSSSVATAADYADAMLTARTARTIFGFALIAVLLVQFVLFAVVHFTTR